jgi:L-gulonolactone oxidase
VNLDRLNQLVNVDTERMQVTVGAGIRLKDLCELLSQHGLALENIGSVDQQSLAGATATGTHGTGIRIGNLSTGIVGMNLVTGTGKIFSLSADKDPELLTAARVSLGALGVVTQITLQCVRAYNLRLDADLRPFDQVLEQLDQLNAENERVRYYWFSGTDVFYVMRFNLSDEPMTRVHPAAQWLNDVFLRQGIMWTMLRAGHLLPSMVDPLNRFQTRLGLRTERTIRRSDRALTVPMPPVHQEMEYAVPVERTAEALRMTRNLIREKGYRASFPVEVRFVAGDCNMLSPAYGRDVCYVGAYTFGSFTRPYFDGFEPEMKRLGGRPHWGKYHTLTANEARELYPCYDRFNQIRKELLVFR